MKLVLSKLIVYRQRYGTFSDLVFKPPGPIRFCEILARNYAPGAAAPGTAAPGA